MAVCDKLLKRAVAIAESGVPYQADCAQKFVPMT